MYLDDKKVCLLKLVLIAMLVLIFLIAGQTAKAEVVAGTTSPPVTEAMYGYCEKPLNVREEMSIESRWISQYPSDSTIILLEDMGEWYRVDGGFVKKEFVFDSVEIYRIGKVLFFTLVFSDADFLSDTCGFAEPESEVTIVKKQNGFLLIDNVGWVHESAITFDFMGEEGILPSVLTKDDMETWNMSSLPIRYIGTLEKRTKGTGVTRGGALYFKGAIPVYDIVDGYAYLPSGQHIYKIPMEKFVGFENVGPTYHTIAAYRTVFYNSPSARKHNIELVSTYLDGVVISRGGTFSYNSTTGSRSEAKGYKEANVIVNGAYELGFGGGVCQVSSTIYAAIMNNQGFKVTQRKPHGLDVSYLPYGMDATVSYGSIDLKFVNQYSFDVVLNVKSADGVCLVTITRAN